MMVKVYAMIASPVPTKGRMDGASSPSRVMLIAR